MPEGKMGSIEYRKQTCTPSIPLDIRPLPLPLQLLYSNSSLRSSQDLAESLVKYGRAVPEAAGLDSHPIIDGVNYEMNLDGSKEVEVLQNDVRRMRTLNDLEVRRTKR